MEQPAPPTEPALMDTTQLETDPEPQQDGQPASQSQETEPDPSTEEAQDEEQETEGRVEILDDKGRQVKRSARLQGQQLVQVDVNHDEAVIFTRLMQHHNLLASRQEQGSSSKGFNGFNKGYSKAVKAISFIETFSLKRGIAKFGEPGREAAKAEMKQLHERTAFTPLHPEEMTPAEQS